MKPNADQQRAIDAVGRWLAAGATDPFVLGGLAGTGKTALLPMLQLPSTTRYVCPTWKAAQVLQHKLTAAGVDSPVTSIHSLIYNPAGVVHKVDCTFTQTGQCSLRCSRLAWSYNPRERPALLVVDEASMVGGSVRRDLDRLGSPVLYVGDVGQLPPVKDGRGVFDELGCDVELKTIQRQAEGSPIIALSRHVRSGDRKWLDVAELLLELPVFRTGPGSSRRYSLRDADHGSPDTVFIAGTNRAVDHLNRKVRQSLGRGPALLVPGERVMLQNSLHDSGIYNGQLGTVTEVVGPRWVELQMESGASYSGPVLIKGSDDIPQDPGVPVVRHSYAVTCHKAQGSEFRNVVVFLEQSPVETRQWLYTAITRATHSLTFVVA